MDTIPVTVWIAIFTGMAITLTGCLMDVADKKKEQSEKEVKG